MIIYRGEPQITQIVRIYTDFKVSVMSSLSRHLTSYMRPFDYAQGDRYICAHPV